MCILALDLGKRYTGVAYADRATRISFPMPTIKHEGDDELLVKIGSLIRERRIDVVILGNPLLPSGEPGSQAQWVASLISPIEEMGVSVSLVDERYTSAKATASTVSPGDPHAMSACAILDLFLAIDKG